MKKKTGLSVYLDPDVLGQLTKLAARKKQSISVLAEAAIISFLTPDEADQREAAFARRLDLLTRQVDRLERDLSIATEALALFIRFSLTVAPILPEAVQAAAQAKGRERFESFLQTLGQRLAKGQSLLRELPIEETRDAAVGGTRTRVNRHSNGALL
jgi:hypothetical protein